MAAASDPRSPADAEDPVDQFIDEVEALVHALRSGRLVAQLLRAPKDQQVAALAELRRVLQGLSEIIYAAYAVDVFNVTTTTSHKGTH